MLGEHYDGIVCSDRWRRLRLPRPHQTTGFSSAHLPPRLHRAQRRNWQANNKCRKRRTPSSRTDLFEAWQQFRHDSNRACAPGPGSRHSKPGSASNSAPASRNSTKDQMPPAIRPRPPPGRWPALWTFTGTEDVEQTNNGARRGLRGAVIPATSLGAQSDTRRTEASTVPLRLDHLPAPPPVPLPLPHRSHHRPRPRRPNTQPRLTATNGLNAYSLATAGARRENNIPISCSTKLPAGTLEERSRADITRTCAASFEDLRAFVVSLALARLRTRTAAMIWPPTPERPSSCWAQNAHQYFTERNKPPVSR